jgi:hypothetical protein
MRARNGPKEAGNVGKKLIGKSQKLRTKIRLKFLAGSGGFKLLCNDKKQPV